MKAFNILEVDFSYTNITVFSTDLGHYTVNSINPSKLSQKIGGPKKIRLLKLTYFLEGLFFINLGPGEAPFRRIISYDTEIKNYFLNGISLKNNLTNFNLATELNQSKHEVDFGEGIIIDDLELTNIISNVVIDDPPPSSNSPFSILGKLQINYNNNYLL